MSSFAEDPSLAESAMRHADAVLAAPFKPRSARVMFAIALALGLIGDGWRGLSTQD